MTALKSIGLVVAGVIVGLLFSVVSGKDDALGGKYNQITSYFANGLYAGSSNQFSVSSTGAVTTSADATVSGGTLNVTTANSATSTAIAGCVQTYATSTATAIKLTLGVTASTATTTFYGGTSKGAVYWEYGTCPNL